MVGLWLSWLERLVWDQKVVGSSPTSPIFNPNMSFFRKNYLIFIFFGADLALILFHFFLRKKLGFFDLDKEGNLGSLYAGVKLWSGATAALLSAVILRRLKAARLKQCLFLFLALGLAYIGLDDMMAIHERLGFVLNNIFGLGGFYGESFNWLIFYTPFMIFGMLVFFGLARELWRDCREASWWFLIGTVLLVGSMGVEFLGRDLLLQIKINIPLYHALIVVEEGLEMFGASCLVFAIFVYFQKLFKKHIQVSNQ